MVARAERPMVVRNSFKEQRAQGCSPLGGGGTNKAVNAVGHHLRVHSDRRHERGNTQSHVLQGFKGAFAFGPYASGPIV